MNRTPNNGCEVQIPTDPKSLVEAVDALHLPPPSDPPTGRVTLVGQVYARFDRVAAGYHCGIYTLHGAIVLGWGSGRTRMEACERAVRAVLTLTEELVEARPTLQGALDGLEAA